MSRVTACKASTSAFAAGILTATALGGVPAYAAQPLSRAQRKAIVSTTYIHAPDGGRITAWRCIGGQLSTVDRRFAATELTNTPSCVDRYGGATGEATLDYRASATSGRWRAIGVIGGSGACPPNRLAPNGVLRDLGCAEIVATARAE